MKPEYAQIGMVLACIFFLLQVAGIIITIWQRLRRNPPIDQTLAQYVRRIEFDRHCDRDDAVQKEIFALQRKITEDVGREIKDFSTNLGNWQNGVAQQIGRIEGQIVSMKENNNANSNHPTTKNRSRIPM